MDTRLSIKLNAALLSTAEQQAKQQGISLSTFLSNILTDYLSVTHRKSHKLPEKLQTLKGSLSGIKNIPVGEDERLDYLLDRHIIH
jgi:hypothetical protein